MDVYIPKSWLGLLGIGIALALLILCFLSFVWQSRHKNTYSPFTEDALRPPGHALRIKHTEFADAIGEHYGYFLFATTCLIAVIALLSGTQQLVLTTLLLVTMALLLLRLWKLYGTAQEIKLALEGEEYTGQELNLLMLGGAHVFHDIPGQGGVNIDHIVIAKDKVFVVETKARRKPQSSTGGRNSTVIYDGEYLKFPDTTTDQPLIQARTQADFLNAAIQKNCQLDFPVKAVVSLPGWFIENETKTNSVLVINPKRGKALTPWVGDLTNEAARERVTHYIASVARSVTYKPGTAGRHAPKNQDVWLKPRLRETSLGL